MRFDKFRNLAADLITAFYEEEYEKMPYIRKGNTVYKKEGGHLKKVGTSSKSEVKSYMKTLRAVEHGWKPTGKRKK